jgi:dTMP kinase
MRRGFLVCFTGLDGAGKTSLAKGVVKDLQEDGVEADYRYLRYQPILLKPIIMVSNRTITKTESFTKDYSSYSKSKVGFSDKHPLLALLYQSALLFDYYLQVLVKLRLPLSSGKNIVCDRYVYDTVATDLTIDFNLTGAKVQSYLKTLFKVFPRPDLSFYVDITEEEAFRRKTDVPSIAYLKDRKWVYLLISKSEQMVVLNGLEKPEELRAEAEQVIRGVLG